MNTVSSHLAAHYRRADALLLFIIWALFAGALALAPQYGTWTAAWAVGLPSVLLATAMVRLLPGHLATRLVMGALVMVFTGLHIHQGYGETEFHFGVFVLLAVLLCYRDWRVIMTAASVIAIHHLASAQLQMWGYGIICFAEPGYGRVLVHAAYVVAESAALCYIAVWLHRDAVQAAELSVLVECISARDTSQIDLALDDLHVSSPAGVTLLGALHVVADAVGRVRHCARFLKRATTTIVAGGEDLREATRLQAEETRAATRAVSALSGIANATMQYATESGQHVSNVVMMGRENQQTMQDAVRVMEDVNGLTGKIGEIVKVIDGIAFQTNILALNAAVEAARAGEQGKSFAVVAGEVRNLAQRCAHAAREIRELIESSNATVSAGCEMVNRCGQSLSQLVDGLSRLSGAFHHVVAGNQEQVEQLKCLEDSIARVEQLVDRNRLRVESSAQSALDVDSQTVAMVDVMSRFRLTASAPALT